MDVNVNQEKCSSININLLPYSWDEPKSYADNEIFASDQYTILAWCMTRQSETALVRITGVVPFAPLELPSFVDGKPFFWRQSNINTLFTFMSNNKLPIKVDDEDEPLHKFGKCHKLYYHRKNETQFLRLFFNSYFDMRKVENFFLDEKFSLPGIGKECRFTLWETGVSMIRKMLTARKMQPTQWFTIPNKQVSHENRISKCKYEYIIPFKRISPIDIEKTSKWFVYPTILSWDIETYSTNHSAMPKKYNIKHKAYIISCVIGKYKCSAEDRKIIVIVLSDVNFDDPRLQGPNKTVIRVDCETELIAEFCKQIEYYNPHIIIGYNICGYDYPYLDARLGIRKRKWPKIGMLRDFECHMSNLSWHSSAYGYQNINILKMHGRITVDLIAVIKREYKFENYKLETTAQHILSRGKDDVSPKEMFIAYENVNKTGHLDPSDSARIAAVAEMTKIVAYCIKDSDLVSDLFDKLSLFSNMVETSNVFGTPMELIYTRGQQVKCVNQLYDIASQGKIVMDFRAPELTSFAGGFVGTPVPGWHPFTGTLDFNSMYPNIIRAYNLCYTTYIPMCPEDMKHMCFALHCTKDKEDSKSKRKGKNQAATYYFLKPEFKKGLLPVLLTKLINQRNMVKKLMNVEKDPQTKDVYDKRQNALKISANSLFGFLGITGDSGKLPLIEIARVVTQMGQKLITDCNRIMEKEFGCTVLYNDTDSIFFTKAGLKNYEELYQLGKTMEAQITAKQSNACLKVVLEKFGAYFSGGKKKNYVFCTAHEDSKELNRVTTFDFESNNLNSIDFLIPFLSKTKHVEIISVDDKDQDLPYVINNTSTNTNQKVSIKCEDFLNLRVLPPSLENILIEGVKLPDIFDQNPTRIKRTEIRNVIYKGIDLKIIKDVYLKTSSTGILTIKRDKCGFHKTIYKGMLDIILESGKAIECYDTVFDYLIKMFSGTIASRQFAISSGVGSNYKSANAFMNVFAEECKLRGETISPGDRVQYVIVLSGKCALRGKRMRLLEPYLRDEQREKIDHRYYLDKIMMKSLDALYNCVYGKEHFELARAKEQRKYKKLLTHIFDNCSGSQIMIEEMIKSGTNGVDIIKVLCDKMTPARVRNFCVKAKKEILGESVINLSNTNYFPIRNMIKLFLQKSAVMEEINNRNNKNRLCVEEPQNIDIEIESEESEDENVMDIEEDYGNPCE